MEKPVIVVVAYNRKNSLIRLLHSLKTSQYPSSTKIIISIDGGGSSDVSEFATNFKWQFGEKEVIKQKEHLGLRNHIIKCGDLTQEYGSIILLEDDLFVSPMFYEYTVKALEFYRNHDKITGISLYSQNYNMFSRFPFIPLSDANDVYFLQIPASWGESWNEKQWSEFKRWYQRGQYLENQFIKLPPYVRTWAKTSWAKYFWLYMILSKKFFVYPRVSLSTQFGEIGVHSPKKSWIHQVPLQLQKKNFNFVNVEKSMVVYDSYYEILPSRLNRHTPQFKDYEDYTVDLNGIKQLDTVNTEYILTSKRSKEGDISFGREMKPIEMNIIAEVPGNELKFTLKESVNESKYSRFIRQQNEFFFYNQALSTRKIPIIFLLKLLKKV